MKTGETHSASLSEIAKKTLEVDQLITQAKRLTDELVATVSMLNSMVKNQEQKDGN
jgi:hypothetical protein